MVRYRRQTYFNVLWTITAFGLHFLSSASSQVVEKRCGHPAVPPNARVRLSVEEISPKAGTTAKYECDEGYELFGTQQRECTMRGEWTGDPPFCGTNVAFRKPANQSTTVRGGSAVNGNDGEKTTEHDGKRCTETQREASPWWQVDLLRHYAVKVVRVTTRGCCGHQPLQDLEIRVGNSSTDLQRNPLCAWFPGTIDEGVTKTFTCARPLIGQHVFLQLVGVEGSLSLCEVEIFTTEEFSNDRCAPPSAPADIQLAAFSRTCYEFNVAKGGSFEEARKHCQGHGGDLIHGFQGATSSFLLQELERRKAQLKTQLVWVGAQKEPGLTSRTWRWVNGETVSRPAWGKDQPNNYNGEQNCAVLDGGRSWLWNDVGCNLDYLHWICQHLPAACGSPDKLLNTTIVGHNYSVGSEITYKCPVGHMLVGEAARTCGKDGFWTGTAPSCKYVDCEGLSPIADGLVTLIDNRTTHSAVALYTCHENYTLIGKSERVCSDDGTWSESVPQCLFDWCPDPPNVVGSTVKVDGHKAGSLAIYTCHPGFILFGQQCDLYTRWHVDGHPPSCKYIDCGTPAQIDRGSFNLLNGSTTYESIAQYSCEVDHWLDGAEYLTCNRDGKWSHDTPACELITCDEPEVPPGGYVVGYDLNVHSSIEYHCEVGHKLVGESTLTCQQDGEWSRESPLCEYVDCGKLPSMLYGSAEYINGTTHLASLIHYSCTTNYRLVGPVTRICQDNHQWSDTSPKCEEIRCPEPIVADNSIVSVTGNDRMYGRTLIRTAESYSSNAMTYKIGALVKYRCERGYKVIGESLSTCEDTGAWSGNTPKCQYVDCGNPGRIANGKVTLATNATYYGAAALYECDKNWQLDGVSRRLCQDNGTWSSEAPVCKEITCNDPSTFQRELSPGLHVITSTRSIGGVAHYRCDRGYTLQGNTTRSCLPRGSWNGQQPICLPVDCGDTGIIENGRIIITNGTTLFASTIEYHCLPHYQRVGPFLRKCMEDGNWSGEDPSCELISNETQDSSNLPLSVGIGCGVVLFLLLLLGIIYMRLRKATPVKNTENVEGAERKEDQNAAVMSYSTLHDGTNGIRGNHIYDHVNDNVYDSPYSDHLTDNHTYNRSQGDDSDTTYEPEPQNGPSAVVTINGVAVR